MNSIILSINPKHVNSIKKGIKKYEYRTKVAKRDVNKIIIYETTPTKKIIGEADIIDVMSMSPNELWENTKEYSGITKDFFDNYFSGRKIAFAYKIGEVRIYDEPKELTEFGLKAAPQSFVYAN